MFHLQEVSSGSLPDALKTRSAERSGPFPQPKCCVSVETITAMFAGKKQSDSDAERVQKGLNRVHHVSNLCHFQQHQCSCVAVSSTFN